jgi:hypothetical protein
MVYIHTYIYILPTHAYVGNYISLETSVHRFLFFNESSNVWISSYNILTSKHEKKILIWTQFSNSFKQVKKCHFLSPPPPKKHT